MNRLTVFVLAIMVFSQTMVFAGDTAIFIEIGYLDGGYDTSSVYGVSRDGSTVLGKSESGLGTEAFRWTDADGMIGLGDLEGDSFWSFAFGASANGTVVVGQGRTGPGSMNEGFQAFRWTQAEGMVGLGTLGSSHLWSTASAISDDGSVIVGNSHDGRGQTGEAVIWTADGGIVGLGHLHDGDLYSYASDVSADGLVVVGFSSTGAFQDTEKAFRWTAADGMVSLGIKGKARAVSADGSVIVGTIGTDDELEAFRWTEQTGVVRLGDLPGLSFYSIASAVSADGSIVVGRSEGSSSSNAFIWDEQNGMRDLKDVLTNDYGLDLGDWKLSYANGISDDGRTIVGYGSPPQINNPGGWMVRLPGTKIYVDADATGENNGQSWADAYTSLFIALDNAAYGDEIRVAQGTYRPTDGIYGGGRELTFQLKNGVIVKGGYAGFGEPDPDARDIDFYETILSGDLLGNDEPDFVNNDDNSYHVVTGSGTNETAVMDGFTITAGHHKLRRPYPNDGHFGWGGGMYNNEGSPTVMNCSFIKNLAEEGGGMYNLKSSPTVTGCTFRENRAPDSDGGGMYNYNSSNPIVRNCTFINNFSDDGGGMFNREKSSPKVTGCTFSNNIARDGDGGGMYNSSYSNPEVTDCSFTENSCDNDGGGIKIGNGCVAVLRNCMFSKNYANDYGGGVYNSGSNSILINCTFSENTVRDNGGGMSCRNGSQTTLINCTFSMNIGESGGGMYIYESNPTLTNCRFIANTANGYHGGGMYNYGSNSTLTNCTFTGNSADDFGGAIYNNESSPIVTNCILWENGFDEIYVDSGMPIVTYSDIRGGWPGAGNISANPLFVDHNGADGIAGTNDDDLRLSANSPCIDAGDNSVVTVTTDLDGNARIVDTVDMGAYEFTGTHLVYVDADAAGDNSGQSWADAYTSLVEALKNTTYPYEVRVAQGTYRPNDPNDDGPVDERELTFRIRNGVSVKGGYAGFGESDPDARDIELFKTILSGDLAGNDEPVAKPSDLMTEPTRAENCYNVALVYSGAILDGVTITAGKAEDAPEYFDSGGGLRIGGAIVTNCSIIYNTGVYGGGLYSLYGHGFTLVGCKFIGNSSLYGGGGLYSISDNAVISDCLFDSNFTGGSTFRSEGGGACVYGYDVYIANCTFRNNQADYGGGLYNNDHCGYYATNCLFTGNWANEAGGGVYIGHITDNSLIGCTITGNSAGDVGGGVYDYYSTPITNCIIWGNYDSDASGESSQIYGGTSGVSHSCIQDWTGSGEGNIGADPLFVDPNGADGIAGTGDEDLRLSADSLCIDSGDNSAVTTATDLDGNERIFNNFADMGAHEFTGMHIIYVDDDAVGDPVQNGTAAHPFDLIYEATAIAKDGHKVVVMPGTYLDPEIVIPEIPIAAAYIDKNIILTSADPTDPLIVNNTLLSGRVVFSGTEDSTCKLKGFKISNPLTGSIIGNGTHAEISNCIISGNGPCQGTVINDCDGLIANCVIADNTASDSCGGPFPTVYGCNGLIRNCTIANNVFAIGDWSGGSTTLENCIIYSNGDGDDSQVSISGGGPLDISYCNIQDGFHKVDSDGDVNWGLGNIDVYPDFVRWGLWDYDAMVLEEGNYHLQSNGWRWSEYEPGWTYDLVTSRCIDAGNPGSPLGGELMSVPRDPENIYGINLRVNMGAYGGTPSASMAPYGWAILGDLTNDGVVDSLDLAAQAEDWLTDANEQPGDLNRDEIVNIADFALLAKDWILLTDWVE
ncbi:MAG: right-handed parallel beta-helix repeat-containing protein [Phycisphaerae bacterium]|nr:right-handed parallel beta-helix repeat-containing protein [Phycisphaerae bacterium]